MKYSYNTLKDLVFHLCTEHAEQINENEALVLRDVSINEIQNCVVCDNEKTITEIIQDLQ